MTINRAIFSGMQALIGHDFVKDRAVVVEDNIIKAIIPADMISHHMPAKHYEFPQDAYLVPGFIDLHVHGANGKDVMDDDAHALKSISSALAEEGVTSFLPTTMTANITRIEDVLRLIASFMDDTNDSGILGIHLEGPFIAKEKIGAHVGDETILPDTNLIKSWQKLTNNKIKIVTLAPELPGSIPFIQSLKQMEIIAAIGHTNATYEETNAAIKAGCTQATHLFNAMRGIHQREPGATCALLLSDAVIAELIVDGIHLHPAIINLAHRVKGKDKLLLVTDAMRAKCLGDGRYELGGQTVNVEDGRVTLADGTLAGSVLRMPMAIKNMAEFSRCSLAEAVYMASLNPARSLKIDNQKGSIDYGKDADLVVMNADFQVMLTMRAGKTIFSCNHNTHK